MLSEEETNLRLHVGSGSKPRNLHEKLAKRGKPLVQSFFNAKAQEFIIKAVRFCRLNQMKYDHRRLCKHIGLPSFILSIVSKPRTGGISKTARPAVAGHTGVDFRTCNQSQLMCDLQRCCILQQLHSCTNLALCPKNSNSFHILRKII